MELTDFKKGDRVVYTIRPGHFLPATVVNVTKKRVVLRVDGHKSHRVTLPKFLVRSADFLLTNGTKQP